MRADHGRVADGVRQDRRQEARARAAARHQRELAPAISDLVGRVTAKASGPPIGLAEIEADPPVATAVASEHG